MSDIFTSTKYATKWGARRYTYLAETADFIRTLLELLILLRICVKKSLIQIPDVLMWAHLISFIALAYRRPEYSVKD